ncbi:MAG TPA: decarboxylating 6-phosphogluconate dehydrogenase [Dehalococcoidia bacterium]|nr:decarboxylating 6-phosphogluconate dehydrogenase [Dehalococcoidia bacterium]
MNIGMIGLGKMGGNMVTRMLNKGHSVVCYDTNEDIVTNYSKYGATSSYTLNDLVSALPFPRFVWLMLPHGDTTYQTINELIPLLKPGDTIIDGGNNKYQDSINVAKLLNESNIRFLDVGTSGGIWGLNQGYSLMVGGDKQAYLDLEPVIQSLAPDINKGYGYVGSAGAGHYLKMVHNGIEYALMESYAEGLELLHSTDQYNYDLEQVATIWSHGSVIRSWLLELIGNALSDKEQLSKVKAYVEDSGEGRWTVIESVRLGIPLPVITSALQQRFRSRQTEPLGAKLLSLMRNYFGGHKMQIDDIIE